MTSVRERAKPAPPASRHMGRRLGLAAAMLGVVLLAWVVWYSSLIGVHRISITGEKFLSAGQIRSAAAIKDGTPLIRLDTAAIERRLRSLPDIASVTVRKSYPRAVEIAVVERVPVGCRTVDGKVWLVDAGNVAFRTVGTQPKQLPVLDGTGAAIAAVAGSLGSDVARKVAGITAPSSESITLTLRDGRVVLWGGTDRNADKARLLPALLGQPGSYFDVSDPDTVISRSGR